MINHQVLSRVLDKLIYLSIFALFIVPFLIPYSYFPVSKFYSEISALAIAGFIGLVAIIRTKQIGVSSAGLACLGFALFLFSQIWLIPIRFPGVNIAIALEFLVALFLSIGITSLVDSDEQKQRTLVTVIAWAALIGATIQAIYGFLQYTGQAANLSNLILFVDSQGTNIFGNVGQKNDYVDFLSLGIFALTYLFFTRQVKILVYIVYTLFFAFVITVNTSRTSFTYFIFAILTSVAFYYYNRKDAAQKTLNQRVLLILTCLCIGLLVIEAGLPKLIELISGHEATSGLYRFGADSVGQSTYRRFYEWYKDIIIFLQHPLWGIGWYQYPYEAIKLMLTERFMYIPANSALYTHSHNSPLNILAETGIVGFFITMVYGFAYSLYKMFKHFNNHATLFISFMILTIFAQSLFQYPLWYSYFLMFFVLFLSINKPSFSFPNNMIIRASAGILFMVFLWLCIANTLIYNQLVSYTAVPQDSDDYSHNVQQLKQLVEENKLWSLPALLVLDSYNLPGSPLTNSALSLEEQKKYIDMVSNELPYPGAIYKQIIIHKITGDDAGAVYYANLLAHGFPYFKDKFAAQLQADPRFNDEISTIYNFQYEDKSIFARIFSKKGQQ
jgi:O-antigen ligase